MITTSSINTVVCPLTCYRCLRICCCDTVHLSDSYSNPSVISTTRWKIHLSVCLTWVSIMSH